MGLSVLTHESPDSREQMTSEPYRTIYQWKERSETLRFMYDSTRAELILTSTWSVNWIDRLCAWDFHHLVQ